MCARPNGSSRTPPGRALFGTLRQSDDAADPSVMGKDSGVANTNIVWHAGRLLALEEAHKPFELDPLSLESQRLCRATTAARSPPIRRSIPRPARWSGSAIASASVPFTNTVSYGVTDAAGEVVRRDDFEAPFCSMVHDFLVTSGHALFPILPLTGRSAAGDERRPGLSPGSRTRARMSASWRATPASRPCAGSRPRPATSSTR